VSIFDGGVVMASRASNRRFWRDIRVVYVLLVWAAFTTGLFVYFDGRIALHSPAPSGAALRSGEDAAMYRGSVVVMPQFGNSCRKMIFDNRTGRMWANGYVDCDTAVGSVTESKREGATGTDRFNAIGAAFRNAR
jgi:hypothetical protein